MNKAVEHHTISASAADPSVTAAIACREFVHLSALPTSNPASGSRLRLELSPDGDHWSYLPAQDNDLTTTNGYTTTFGGLQMGIYFRLRTVDGSGDPVDQTSDLELVCVLSDQVT